MSSITAKQKDTMTTESKMTVKEIKIQARKIWGEKGLQSVRSFLKKSGVAFEEGVCNFGWQGTKRDEEAKTAFLRAEPENELRFHYYGIGGKAHHNGYHVTSLRAIWFEIK